MDEKIVKKFWDNVEKSDDADGCWNWKGRIGRKGSPIIVITVGLHKQKEYTGRRVSLELHDRLLEDKYVYSKCKNYLCVNPSHIVSGDEARFWLYVNPLADGSGCWEWTAGRDRDEYGYFSYMKEGIKIKDRAHVYSWELHNQSFILSSFQVCHTCDHPWCINPKHLWLGTTQENTQDRVDKGRSCSSTGEENGCSKLTEQEVREIRDLAQNLTHKKIGSLYGVSQSVVSRIVTRDSWKHVL
jgi:hypothetical protein